MWGIYFVRTNNSVCLVSNNCSSSRSYSSQCLSRHSSLPQVIRSGQKVGAKKVAAGQKQAAGGFFSGWFGRKTKKEEQEPEATTEESKSTCRLHALRCCKTLSIVFVAVSVSEAKRCQQAKCLLK